MKWHELGEVSCPVARSLSILGDRWTLLIIRNAFMKTRRFDDFQKQLGITRHLLADRLNRLVENNIFTKVLYQEAPKRYEYRLTKAGLELYPVILVLTKWGNAWLNEDNSHPPFQFVHKPCGHVSVPQLVCSECGEELHARDMEPFIGMAGQTAST